MVSMIALLAVLAFPVSTSGAAEQSTKPRQIVSLNLCSDQILFELVDRSRIAAMFHLTADPQYSNIADRVGGVKLIRGGAEEVMRLEADLVIAGPYTTKATVALLRRLGKRVVIVPVATDFEIIARNITLIAKAVGAEARGAALLSAYKARLKALKSRVGAARPLAAVTYTNNYSAKSGSLADVVLREAGFRNLGSRAGGALLSVLGLEDLVYHRPDLLILGHAPENYHTVLGDNLRHPVLRSAFKDRQRIRIPERQWLCGTPHTLDALERLISMRARLGG